MSLGAADRKKAYDPLIYYVTDGFKIVDNSLNLVDMKYESESAYDPTGNWIA